MTAAVDNVLVESLKSQFVANELRTAIVEREVHWTYGELSHEIDHLRSSLRSVGAHRATRVAIRCASAVRSLAAWLAALELDALVSILPTRGDGHGELRRFNPHVVIDDNEITLLVNADLEGLSSSLPCGAVVFTSGTTGNAKLVVHGQRSLANVLSQLLDLRHEHESPTIRSSTLSKEVLQAAVAEPMGLTYASAMPMSTIGGITMALQALFTGDRLVIPESAEVSSLVDAIRRHGATNLSLTPLLARYMTKRLRAEPLSHPMLFIAIGGSAVPAVLAEDLERVTSATVVCGYGATESGPLCVGRFDATSGRRHGSCGAPLPGVNIRILEGELWVRSRSLFEGYLSDDCQSVRGGTINGWWHTGDYADFNGRDVVILGRSDDTILRSGRLLHPVPLEQSLETVGGVERVAVIGLPSPRLAGEFDVVAVLQASATSRRRPTTAYLRRVCFEKTGVAPQRVVWVDEVPIAIDGSPLRRRLCSMMTRPESAD